MANAYDKKRAAQAKKACKEFLGTVVTKPGPDLDRTMRLIGYMVKRMGYNTVIGEQEPNWLLGHMAAWARAEVALDRRRRAKKICSLPKVGTSVMVDIGSASWQFDTVAFHEEPDDCGKGESFTTAEWAGHWHLCDEGKTWKRARKP